MNAKEPDPAAAAFYEKHYRVFRSLYPALKSGFGAIAALDRCLTRCLPEYCDVALPVPIDRLFTYRLPLTLRHRVMAGCRVVAPLGSRKLTGVVLHVHNARPSHEVREVLSLRDAEPVLDDELIRLGQWIAEYYCAPIGEVLKGMLPLSGEIRRTTNYSLTEEGHSVARQLTNRPQGDPALQLLTMLEERPRSAEYVAAKIGNSKTALRDFLKRGWVVAEEREEDRDPMRAKAERLEATFLARPLTGVKLKKTERELLAFLELHPGSHNVAELGEKLKQASEAARSLARRELIKLEIEPMQPPSGFERPRPVLNAFQQTAVDAIREALDSGEFRPFLLEGVTGSGKTEVYLCSIEAALALGRNALLLVPEIALTPAVAGQFFHRFGKQVAILHSAFSDTRESGSVASHSQRAGACYRRHALRRICARAKPRAPRDRRRARRQLQATGDAALSREGRRFGPGQERGGGCDSWIGHTEHRDSLQRGERQIWQTPVARAYCATADAASRGRGHAARVSRDEEAGDVFAKTARGNDKAAGAEANRSCCC